MSNIYVNFGDGSTTGYYAVAKWQASHTYSASSNGGRGDFVRQLAVPTIGNERVFRCTTAGAVPVSDTVEPAWALTQNGAANDNNNGGIGTLVWTECTGQEVNQVSSWTAPHARLANALATPWSTGVTNIFVGDNHAGTISTANLTLLTTGCNIVCVNHSGSIPPVSADLRATATEGTTSTRSVALTGTGGYLYGITFTAGSGATNAQTSVGNVANSSTWKLESCVLAKLGTTASQTSITLGPTTAGVSVAISMRNTKVKFGNVGDGIAVNNAYIRWTDTPSAISGSAPTSSLYGLSNNAGDVFHEGVDVSAVTVDKLIPASFTCKKNFIFKDCKLGSGTLAGSTSQTGLELLDIIRSDSSGTNYRQERHLGNGTYQIVTTSTVRTGGASDGTTSLAWYIKGCDPIPIEMKNLRTATNITVTFYGFGVTGTLPTNADIWGDVEYLGSASSPQASYFYGGQADILAAATSHTADSSAWDTGTVAARLNNVTSYRVGDFIKVASNTGRIFVCENQDIDGMGDPNAASEPGAYATAVDGQLIIDGNVSFRAVMRFSKAITISSPQVAQTGYMYMYFHASSIFTGCIDPKVVLT